MKPFFTDQILFQMSNVEAANLRAAVAHMRDNYSDRNSNGELIFPDKYKVWDDLYQDLTKIVEMLPF